MHLKSQKADFYLVVYSYTWILTDLFVIIFLLVLLDVFRLDVFPLPLEVDQYLPTALEFQECHLRQS